MTRVIGGLFTSVIMAVTVFFFSALFSATAGVLRLLPQLVPVLARASWGALVLSCRVYYLLLTRLAAPIRRHWKIDILDGLWRLACTLALSLVLGLVLCWLMAWPVSGWTVFLSVLHGLFVDLMWAEIPDAGHLRTGVRIQ